MKKLLIIALALAFSTSLFAQVKSGDIISGHVYDDIDAVMSATVVEVDANNRNVAGATTDIDGNFSFKCVNPKNKILVKFLGYESVTLPIDRKVFKIKLKSASQQIKEVEIKVKRREVQSSGLSIPVKEISVATQTMNMAEVEGLAFTSVDEALQGKIAGLDIIANSGNLGAGTSMRLRGVSTINGSAEPLIVVDGNILDIPDAAKNIDFNDLGNEEQFATLLAVNPEDIADIKVLKDAASAAIWGSRGANGVLEITTKRGKTGKTSVNFSYKFTGSWSPAHLNMLDGDGYTMMLKEAYFNPRQSSDASNIVELNYDKSRGEYYYNFNKNTDWVDEVNQFGQSHNYSMTIQGGGEKARFYISGSYDHQTGTIIKQELDRFSTRLKLDYDVSDRIRFETNVALTYTKNHRNWDGGSVGSILDKAYKAMPNMSVYEYDQFGNPTGEYYKMQPTYGITGNTPDGYSSHYLEDMKNNGNPVAIANYAYNNQSTYTITPNFKLTYKLLGKDFESHQLNLSAEVFMNIYNESVNSYYPSELSTDDWRWNKANSTSNNEIKSMNFTNREMLTFAPHFNTENVSMQAAAIFEINSSSSNSQNYSPIHNPTGIESPNAGGYLGQGGTTGTGIGRSASLKFTYHLGLFDSRYALDFTLTNDGCTKFGAGKKWASYPAISLRWNISDEPIFRKMKWANFIDLLSFRPSWGMVGQQPGSEFLMYNKYSNIGKYGAGNYMLTSIGPDNLRLTDLKWQTVKSWNWGFNLEMFKNKLAIAVDIYNKKTSDLLMGNVKIPSTSGYNSLPWCNVGEVKNEGWEFYINGNKFIKFGKFSMDAFVNFAQNFNTITSMDKTVLEGMNNDFEYRNLAYLNRIQIGNAVGSIYGFRYKGVYAYDYEHCGYTDKSYEAYGTNTAKWAAEHGGNGTCPVARDAKGNILFDAKGNPLHMYFNYGGINYEFKGGDVMYEDINNDGQINELDIVYLGNSNPKLTGGFGCTFHYAQWDLKMSFNYRIGNKIVNIARQENESMRNNNNQSQAVAWRWRKNGDVTEIPRAMNEGVGISSYNALACDRFVEDGDFVRLQYAQLSYNLDPKTIKKLHLGFKSLRLSLSANNLFCWTKYTGIDPEVGYGAWGRCEDRSKTPRAKSFTFNANIGF